MSQKSSFFDVSFRDLRPGLLAREFASGAPAAVVEYDTQCRQAWRDLLQNPRERLPWQTTLFDIARNHVCGGSPREFGAAIAVPSAQCPSTAHHPNDSGYPHLGDVYYFVPGTIAYVGRKFELWRDAVTSKIEVSPAGFVQDGELFKLGEELIDNLWTMTERIMSSLVGDGRSMPAFRTEVHRFKYQARKRDNERLYQLAKHAGGTWAQLGSRIDARRAEARGQLDRRGVRDLFAFLSFVSPVKGDVPLAVEI